MLSARQREIATYGARGKRWTLVSGPVGSGKTHAGMIGFLLAQRRWGDADFGILTKGHPQLASVLRGGLERIVNEPLTVDSDGCFKLAGANGLTNRVWCFVANDRRAEPRLRSFNLSGMLIDEMTTLPYGIIAAANARCRVGPAKLIGLTNPDGPLHPVHINLFKQPDEIDAEVIPTELRDNPALTEEYITSLGAHYTGHMYERMVHGRWAAASGMVYPHIYDIVGEPDEDMVAYDVVIDVGESSVTHALLLGRTPTGVTWILGELRHDHIRHGVLKEREMVAKIRRAFAGIMVDTWVVDPAALRFRQELLNQLGPDAIVGKAENDWDEGVEEVNMWIGQASAPHPRHQGARVDGRVGGTRLG